MHILLTFAGIVLLALTLPLVLELLLVTTAALFFHPEDDLADSHLRLTVIIAAHNEEKLLARTLASIQAAASPANATRIHVIAHNSTDATARIARQANVEVTELNGPAGKGHALLYAFTHLRDNTDAFLILDADTTIAPDLISRVRAALTVHSAIQCRYEAAPAPGTKAQLAALAFRAINVVRPRGRERLGLSAGILGNGFALRASVLDRVPYNAHSIVEDVEFHLDLVLDGVRVHYLDRAHLHGEIAGTQSQHARWEGGRLQIARRKLPQIFRLIARGHLRLIEPALDISGLPQAQAIVLLLIALSLPLVWLRLYAAASLFLIALHVLAAVVLAPVPAAELVALLLAPIYIARKLVGIKDTLSSSRQQAAWQRAERDTRPGDES
jgi:cellulose synthase/poly-beta-1,6-N-acetylglucosamine synthase-like glycosyltransferase